MFRRVTQLFYKCDVGEEWFVGVLLYIHIYNIFQSGFRLPVWLGDSVGVYEGIFPRMKDWDNFP